jgi:ElaB/YqjD/DUF883 family membrane-anchored ribosome-binding protein
VPGVYTVGDTEDKAMLGQKQSGEDRSDSGAGNETALNLRQATDAIDKLRARIDQASAAMRDLTQLSEQWAQGTQGRVREMAIELRNQGERAVSTVSEQIEHNPLTSLAVVFALGCIVGSLIRR